MYYLGSTTLLPTEDHDDRDHDHAIQDEEFHAPHDRFTTFHSSDEEHDLSATTS